MFKDVTLLEEIAEQDLTQASGGSNQRSTKPRLGM